MSDDKPVVQFVDDEPDQLRAFAEEISRRGRVNAIAPIDPNALDDALLERAHLVCMDLSLEHSNIKSALPKLKAQAVRGLGLVTLLQEHVQQEFPKRAIGFALYSGKVSLIGKDLQGGDHVTARVHNVDWVFHKRQDEDEIAQISSLAGAVQALPLEWPASGGALREVLGKWLALDGDSSWAERAWLDIEDCRPPFHGISVHTRGIAFLRWMLHRILPYPTALVDVYQLAARLRVTPESLKKALEDAPELHKLLDPVAYRGQLHDFLGPHWWRAGVNAAIFDLGAELAADLEALQNKVLATSAALKPVAAAQPVVVLDSALRSSPELCSIESAVRVQPDGWPSFASPAWMTIESVRDDEALSSLVVEDDRSRLAKAAEG